MRHTVRLDALTSLLLRGTIFFALALILLFSGYSHAQAAQIGVDSGCSLVDAISSANNDSSVGGCTAGSGPDTIVLSDILYTFTTANNNTAGNNALPPITSTITISPILGSSTLQRIPSGCPEATPAQNFRLFFVESTGDLTLNNISLDFGCESSGGAIFSNGGNLTLFNSALFSNTATFDGGAVFSPASIGVVNISFTTVQSNTAGVDGGALYFTQGSVSNSSFFGNHSGGEGGAIFADGLVDKFLTDNSIFENSSGESGAALYLEDAHLHMDNNVFYSNFTKASNPADIALGGPPVGPSILFGRHNTMVAGSQPATAIAAGLEFPGDQVFVTDTIFSGYNVGLSAQLTATITANGVLWDNTTTPTQTLTGGQISVAHDYFGGAAFVNPAGDNYHLTGDSQAINRGVSNIPHQDFDGVVRPQGLESDLGFVEFVPTISINISKTVGIDANGCASAHQITVQTNTPVFYCLTLLNTGDITLTTHTITDVLLGINTTLPYTLGPGVSLLITPSLISALGPVTITQTVTNVVSVSSTDLGSSPGDSVQSIDQFGTPATDSDSAVVIAEGPISVNISKTVGIDANGCASTHQITVQSNTAVFYCFTLLNTGDVTLVQHTLADQLLGINTTLPITLTPGESVQITRSLISALGPVTATQSVTNTASVTSTDVVSSPTSTNDAVQSIGQVERSATDSDTAVVTAQEPTNLPGAEQPEPRDNRLYLPSAIH